MYYPSLERTEAKSRVETVVEAVANLTKTEMKLLARLSENGKCAADGAREIGAAEKLAKKGWVDIKNVSSHGYRPTRSGYVREFNWAYGVYLKDNNLEISAETKDALGWLETMRKTTV